MTVFMCDLSDLLLTSEYDLVQAFGIGALEDEDDLDVYAVDSLSKYNRVLDEPEEEDNHGWTKPQSRGSSFHLSHGIGLG